MSEYLKKLSLTVNGKKVTKHVEPRTSLADFLRNQLALTGTHVGCEQGACGACTVRVNGVTARSCLTLAVQLEGGEVETIEGASDRGDLELLQKEFHERNALQCGFCTPGILLSMAELLNKEKTPSRERIREYLSGNICRCTGYHAIVDAVENVVLKNQNAQGDV